MFSALRKRLTYANVAMTLALVFIMTGGAYAASKYVITSTKQISPKVLKSLKGANGSNGAPGATGAPGTPGAVGLGGPQGPAGAVGPGGPQGPAGANGTNGANGESVTNTALTPGKGACGAEGGAEFKVGSGKATTACNGKTGYTETLPSGKTETGTWVLNASPEGIARLAISFPIPLKAKAIPFAEPALAKSAIHFIKDFEQAPPGCEGGSATVPTAEPGNLCIYEKILIEAEPPSEFVDPGSSKEGAGASGTMVDFPAKAGAFGWGDWAVTAP